MDTTTDGDEAVDRLARAGFAAKGALYAVLGVLAIRLGLGGSGGGETSQQGAISSLAEQPFGRVLVALLAVGLTGYALFRGVQVFRGGAASFSSLPDWLARVTFGVRAVIYAGLAVLAWREALGGSGGGGSGQTEQSATATVLGLPGGQWLVMGVGAIIVIVGLEQVHEGWTCGFRDHLEFRGISGGARHKLELAGRIGHVARGVVFLVSGGFLGLAAWRHDSEDGVGLDAALQEVVQAPYGPYLLTALGLGLVLYGFFCGVEARFLRPARAD
ncbi:MAG TPA: DUF1206 domain-containing protein [Egicoccus sp.]|nr:DUF1206 domain-containing protein [Egicoccus sp.]HSK24169.1 DUF1206 domain-containing protein [Egicoccus sp.]